MVTPAAGRYARIVSGISGRTDGHHKRGVDLDHRSPGRFRDRCGEGGFLLRDANEPAGRLHVAAADRHQRPEFRVFNLAVPEDDWRRPPRAAPLHLGNEAAVGRKHQGVAVERPDLPARVGEILELEADSR